MTTEKKRRDNKTYAVDSLNEALKKVFYSFNSTDAIRLIATNMVDVLNNASTDKALSEMTAEELVREKTRIQTELSAIDKEILERLKKPKASAKAATKAKTVDAEGTDKAETEETTEADKANTEEKK